jgi:hypothetical protein
MKPRIFEEVSVVGEDGEVIHKFTRELDSRYFWLADYVQNAERITVQRRLTLQAWRLADPVTDA